MLTHPLTKNLQHPLYVNIVWGQIRITIFLQDVRRHPYLKKNNHVTFFLSSSRVTVLSASQIQHHKKILVGMNSLSLFFSTTQPQPPPPQPQPQPLHNIKTKPLLSLLLIHHYIQNNKENRGTA